MAEAFHGVGVTRVRAGVRTSDRDRAATEEPLEVVASTIAGIPMLAAVSAPSSLAIELAEECGITLIGFLRGPNFNIYAHPERVTT